MHLSDGAVDVLRNGKFNHRLLCELIVHENFQRFMTDLEIYVDGYVSDKHYKTSMLVWKQRGQMLEKDRPPNARPEIEDMLEMKVNLQLWVKVKKDWRDSDILLKNFGYNPKDIEMGE